MGKRIVYSKALEQDFEGIVSVLAACSLPNTGLTPTSRVHFLVAKVNGVVVGTIGLEYYGKEALLRSLAVLPEFRKKGVAKRLVKHLVQNAENLKVKSLHLITTTVVQYFLSKGFRIEKKENAPLVIQNSVEFAQLASSTSIYMTRAL